MRQAASPPCAGPLTAAWSCRRISSMQRPNQSARAWYRSAATPCVVSAVHRSCSRSTRRRCNLLGESSLPKALDEEHTVLRSLKGEPFIETREPKGGVELAYVLHGVPCVLHPPGKCAARSDRCCRQREVRHVSMRLLGPHAGGVVTCGNQVRHRNPELHPEHLEIERAQTHGVLESRDGFVGLAAPDPQESTKKPCGSEIGVQHERLVDEVDPSIKI